MEYLSKTYRLDGEVIAWLETLREMHGSVNKGLRSLLPTGIVSLRHDPSQSVTVTCDASEVQLQPGEMLTQSREGVTVRGIRPKGDNKR